MSSELRAAIIARLSDEPQQQAADMHRLVTAWVAFLAAVKGLEAEPSFSIGPTAERPVKRKRGRPRLHVAEPPSAA